MYSLPDPEIRLKMKPKKKKQSFHIIIVAKSFNITILSRDQHDETASFWL